MNNVLALGEIMACFILTFLTENPVAFLTVGFVLKEVFPLQILMHPWCASPLFGLLSIYTHCMVRRGLALSL